MKIPSLALALMLSALAQARPSEIPALVEHRLEDVGAVLRAPEAWHQRRDEEEGVVVYQWTREKVEEAGAAFRAGLTLTVTPDVPGRTGLPPSRYAAELLAFAAEEGGQVKTSEQAPFQILRAEYTVEGEAGEVAVVDVAVANDSTGTLYFLAWQAPKSESDQLAPLREAILGSAVFDPKR